MLGEVFLVSSQGAGKNFRCMMCRQDIRGQSSSKCQHDAWDPPEGAENGKWKPRPSETPECEEMKHVALQGKRPMKDQNGDYARP